MVLRLVILALLAVLAWLLFWPLPSARDIRGPLPAVAYSEAVARFEAFRAERDTGLAAACVSELLVHGARTPRAVILLHGLSNCPRQFDSLARVLHSGGDNVLVPRFPYHGEADRMTDDLARLDSRDLARATAEAVAIARGLGDTVVVAGLSMGGVAAAWAGQNLPGVARVVLISPAFGPPGPPWLAPYVARLGARLPNAFIWWDRKAKQAVAGARETYPRFASHALATTWWLGHEVTYAARRKAPRTPTFAAIWSLSDEGINHAITAQVLADWRAHGATGETFVFDTTAHVQHDMVDPSQPDQQVAKVYPILVRLIDRREPGAPNP